MATSIVSQLAAQQAGTFTPSPEAIKSALEYLTEERERLSALSIALRNRMEDAEAKHDDKSTNLVLMQILDEHVNSMQAMNAVRQMLTAGLVLGSEVAS